jgi:hypothetical protein
VPKFLITSPSGKKYEVNGPPGSTLEQAIAYAQQLEAEEQAREEKGGVGAGFMRGLKSMASSVKTAGESLVDAEKAALEAAERSRIISEKYGEGPTLEAAKKAYEERGALGAAGEAVGSIPEAIAEQLPQMGLTMAGAAAGSAAGSVLGPVGSVVGGITGAVTPSFMQQYGANIQRQAEEDIAAGRDVDISRTAAAAAAVPQAALDVASQVFIVGRVLGKKLFGEVGKKVDELLAEGTEESAKKAEKLAREGLTKTLAKGTAVGVAAEVPTEVVQQALERAQAGLSITGDDAYREYGEIAYRTGLMAPLGGVGRVVDRAAARTQVAKAEPAGDLTQETQEEAEAIKKQEEEAAKPPAPQLPTSYDEAPPELRAQLRGVDSPKKAAELLRSAETRLANLSEDLADPEGVEADAKRVGISPVELEQRLMSVAESLQKAIPYYRLKLEELSGTLKATGPAAPVSPIPQTGAAQQELISTPPPAPPIETPITPVSPIPQGPEAQQTLQIDQAVAESIGIPGAETTPKTQPVTVSSPSGPVAPIPQTAGAQAALPLQATETVEDPLYRQAVEAVVRTGEPVVSTIQSALKVNYKKATELLNRMELEGVVSKANKEGQRQITMGQRQEAPSATAKVSPRIVEQTQPEPVGGGVAVPPQRPEPEGQSVAETPSQGLGDIARVAGDVVQGEGRVEPALGDIDAAVAPTKQKLVNPFLARRRGAVPASPVMARQDVEQAANESVQGWTNAPEVVVLDNENDSRVPKGVTINPDDKGFYHEGKAYVIASRATDKADVHATVYHESIGHFGLRQKFRTKLNQILGDIYRTNPAVRAAADSIKTPGMTNEQAVEEVLASKAEAGPIKEAGIRAAFNRVAAFIRRAGRAMGIQFNYTNNDVAQILRMAQEKVTTGKREVVGLSSVAAAKKEERGIINASAKKLQDLGVLSPERAEMALAFAEQIGDKLRPVYLQLRTMKEMEDIFGKVIPSIRGLTRVATERAVKLREMRGDIANNISKWNDILSDKKYKGVIQKFYRIALESTETQTDFRRTITLKNGAVIPNKDYNSLDKLTGEFESLPQPLKDLYFEMLDAYRQMSDRYVDLITKNLPPTAANLIRKEIESRRIKIYLPLYRDGDYWIRYQDKNNETVIESFNSRMGRLLAIRELTKAGINRNSIQEYSKIEDAFEAPGMGSFGFFGKVNEELDKYYKTQFGPNAQVPGELKQTLYKLFLDTIPASSVRQQFRKREGYKGAKKDLLNVYAIVASRMANQLTNLEYAPKIDEATKLVEEDVAKAGSSMAQQVGNELKARLDFLRDPSNSKWVNRFVFMSYADFILGNMSSAVANTTNLPMIVYPMLGGEYGYVKAKDAMEDAIAMYFQGGWDDDGKAGKPRKFPEADRTAFDPSKIPPNSPLGRLFEEAVKQGAIKHSVGYDIMEARDRGATLNDYAGMLNYTKQVLGWTFQNTERFNREVTLIAAFRLEMEKSRAQGITGRAAEKEAINKAIRFAEEANGETLSELSPRIFQTGPLKVFLTFKRFARAMYALQLRLLRDALAGSKTDTTGMNPQEKAEAEAADRQFRKVAIKQWVGTVGGAFTFAGIQGLPFYGLATSLAAGASALSSAMFGDADDEITDSEEDLKQDVGLGAFRGPVNQIFGIDMASRTGFNGMFWRDDPRRLDEIGLELFAIEQFLGPAYASIRTRIDAVRDFYDGYTDRGLEKLMPVAARNIAKAIRYATDGVQTKDGKQITEDLDAYELFMQGFGFTPTQVSEASARAGARKEIVDKVISRRQALLKTAYSEWAQGDQEGYMEALQDISKWNRTQTAAEFDATIDWDELEQSFRQRSRAAEEAVDGITIPKRYLEGAMNRVKQ